MPLRIKCPACAEEMDVGGHAAGEVVLCRVCGRRLRVPAVTPGAARAASPPAAPAAPPPAAPDAPPPASALDLPPDTPLDLPPDPPADQPPDPPAVRATAQPVAPPAREPGRDAERRPRRPPSDRDAERRPRPRRRQAERGTHTRLLLGLGTLVVLMFLACGGLFVAVWMPHWRTHESERGGFRVELPAAPRDDLAKVAKVQPMAGMTVEGTILLARREDFGVLYLDVPPWRVGARPDDIFDDTQRGMLTAEVNSRVTRQQPVTVSGYPGREVVIESGRGVVVTRMVVADGRLFMAYAGAPSGPADNPRARRFIDSFVIHDPGALPGAVARRQSEERVAEARRQAEEAARAAERRRQEEAAARARAEEERQASLAAFRRAGRSAPDPYAVPGLVLHAHFDDIPQVWPAGAAAVSVPAGATRGPGPRGTALYLTEQSRVVLDNLSPPLREALADSATLSGWVKVRARPVSLVQLESANRSVLGHLSVGESFAAFGTGGAPNVVNELAVYGPRVRYPWQRDEEWHHVAAVRERRRGDEKLTLYWDGRPVTPRPEDPADKAEWGTVRRLLVGVGLDAPPGSAWAGPLQADEPAYAVDEFCVHDRPLSAAEVRVLAGLDPVRPELAGKERPAAPPVVRAEAPVLTRPDGRLPVLTGIAFDPGRRTAWAVTTGAQAQLLRLSYPDLEETGRFRLRGPSGAVAFDPVENQLFVVVGARDAEPQAKPGPRSVRSLAGAVHRYHLADLADAPEGARPTGTLVPAATARPREGQRAEPVTALAVTADGGWVVAANDGRLYRLRTDFPDDAELEPALPPGQPPFDATRLEAPAGADVWVRTPGAFARLDAATGQFVGRLPYPPADRRALADWLLHPSGTRVYATTAAGAVDEIPLGQGLPREVLSPLRGGTTAAYLGRTADGRYVFEAADGGPGTALVSVVDTAAPPGRPLTADLAVDRSRHHAPFWVSPDGAVLVFDTGELVRVTYPAGAAPTIPPASPRPFRIAVAPRPRVVVPALAPLPRVVLPAVAPLPRRVSVRPLPLDRPAPAAATEVAGLRFYLPFDDAPGATVREAVSGKAVGAVTAGQPADGVRGGSLRLARAPGDVAATQLDLTDQKAALRAAANEPFTLALWVRPQVETGAATALTGKRDGGPRPLRLDVTARTGDGVRVTLSAGEPGALQTVNVWDAPSPAPGRWAHVAVVRESAGVVRVFVDGAEARRSRGRGRFAGEFAFESILLAPRFEDAPAALDVDELCLFAVALPADQVRRLAGLPPGELAAPAKGFAPEPYAGGPVPAATAIPGLKYYLPFEPNDRGEVIEAVSGKAVAKAAGAAIDGPRGKAVRLQPESAEGQKQGPVFGLDLGDPGAVRAGANAPFTLAVWVRTTDPEPGLTLAVHAVTPPLKGQSIPVREFHLSTGKTASNASLNSLDGGLRGTQAPVGRPGRWVHLAVVRDAQNKVRVLVDGSVIPGGSSPTDYRFPFAFTRLRLAGGDPDSPPVDLDEFAFYDRALTDDELKRLAGR